MARRRPRSRRWAGCCAESGSPQGTTGSASSTGLSRYTWAWRWPLLVGWGWPRWPGEEKRAARWRIRAMVERAERKWLWGFALVVVLLTTLPYLFGFLSQGSGWVYTGFVFGVQDGNSYIAKMLNGSKGDWLFRSPYTSYPQRGVLAFFPLMLLGKLVPQGQHAALVGLFQAFRIASMFLYVFAGYDFIALFVCQPRWRRLGVTLVTFGGGLGWLSAFGLKLWGSSLPLDFYSPETFGFLMVYGLPHLACARALLLWALRDYLIQPDPLLAWKWGRPGTSGAS